MAELIERPLPERQCYIEPAVLPYGGCMLFGGHAKTGKAERPEEPVLLRSGEWRQIQQLQLGDELASVDGAPSTVQAIQPHDDVALRRVTFRDGRYVDCCEDHLWRVGHYLWRGRDRVLSTRALQEFITSTKEGCKSYVTLAPGNWGAPSNKHIDPWALGYYIGNGSTRAGSVSISSTDPEVLVRWEEIVGADCIHPIDRGFRVADGGQFAGYLRELGLFHVLSIEKFLPSYVFAETREFRVALLRGLLDSDGCAEKGGELWFGSSSRRLAEDVQRLAWSLGFIACITSRIPHFSYRGERRTGERAYRVGLLHAHPREFVTLTRKLDRLNETQKPPRCTIKSIESIGRGPAVCIGVSHPSRLYITRDYIPTHNSFMMLELARAVAMGVRPFGAPGLSVPKPERILIIEQEIGEWGLQKRAKSIFAGENRDLLRENFRGVSKLPSLDFRDPSTPRRIADLAHKVEAKVVFLDPIGKMHSYDENSNTEIAHLFNKLQELRTILADLATALVISHHFGKPIRDPRAELTEEQEFSPYNFRGASKWYDDPDTLVTVCRRPAPETRGWKHWRLKTHWETRQGGDVPEWLTLSANLANDLRVRFVSTDTTPLGRDHRQDAPKSRTPSTEAGPRRI